MKNNKKFMRQWHRLLPMLVAVLVLAVNGALIALHYGTVHAYGQITSRSIELSDSTASATSVQYNVGFTTSGSTSIQAIIVDFCSIDPIIGDSCTVPTGFTLTASPGVTGQSGNISTFTTVATQNSNRTLELSAAAGTSVSGAVTFTITGVTNPSASNTTFYARILTFDTTAHANSYSPTGTNTGLVDAGGVALSTANNIVVTAKVQEVIKFCVYTSAGPCGTGSAVTLGDTNGVLSSSGPFVDKTTKFDLQTNAANNAIVRLKGDTLKSGANSIAAIGSTAVASSSGTSQFGFCEYESSGSNLTITGLYNGNNGGAPGTLCSGTTQSAGTGSTGGDNSALFAYDTSTTNTTYGGQIASATAGNSSTATLAFIGNVSPGQVPGIYSSTLIFIATGTY